MIPRRINRAKSYNVIYICKTIKEQGQPLGMFCAEIRYELSRSFVNQIFQENPQKIYIVSDVGLVLYCNNDSLINTSIYFDEAYEAFGFF